MGIVSRIRSFFGRTEEPKQSPRTVGLLARFDAASDSPEMRRHWQNADGLSANASLLPHIQRLLRNRARYECANSPYLKGIVDTVSKDVVGTGPRLQVRTGTETTDNKVENLFHTWADEIRLADKLRIARKAKAESGEIFLVLVFNGRLNHPVKLDIQLLESDQCGDPIGVGLDPARVDGIDYDEFGNPAKYWFFRRHPGEGSPESMLSYSIDAKYVLHYFTADRPGQGRGIPDVAPSLNLCAVLRRFTLATLLSAETAANISLAIQSDAPPEGADEVDPNTEIPFERGMAMTLPAGWKAEQIESKHPNTTFVEFVRTVAREIGRPLSSPPNITLCDSAGLNYSSGRLDHQTYGRAIDWDQYDIGVRILGPIFRAFMEWAVLVEGLLPQELRMVGAIPAPTWMWRGREHVDPVKEAQAQDIRLKNGMTNKRDECAKEGRDWAENDRQRKVEKDQEKDLGLTPALPSGQASGAATSSAKDDDEEDDSGD